LRIQQRWIIKRPTRWRSAHHATATHDHFDLVAAHRNDGTIKIYPGINPGFFDDDASQVIYVPGGPRALAIVDFDRDGWNDLAVALRNFDRVLTFKNSNGVLVASSKCPSAPARAKWWRATITATATPTWR